MQGKIGVSVRYLKMDFWLEMTEYTMDSDCDVERSEYTVTLDYGFTEKPHPFDEFAKLVIGMLADGDHLQNKILEYAMDCEENYDRIYDVISDALAEEAEDAVAYRGCSEYNFEKEN